jgi:hypothetical protein
MKKGFCYDEEKTVFYANKGTVWNSRNWSTKNPHRIIIDCIVGPAGM